MTNENSLQEFEDMFNLSSKDEENGQAEEYGHSMNSKEPFEKLVEDVREDIKQVEDKGSSLEVEDKGSSLEVEDKGISLEVEDPHDIVKDVASRSSEDDQDIVSPVEGVANVEEEDFDSLPDQEIKTEEIREIVKDINDFHSDIKVEEEKEQEEKKKEETEKKETEKKETEDGETSPLDKITVESFSILDGDKIRWSLKSPSTMYDPFYRQKKIVLDSCLAGGQVECSSWNEELRDAQVNVITEVFDQQVIIKQMEEVQQFRNRVKYIGVRVNNQYFLFDRFTPLLRGYLARIQYLKPVLKQDGLILEHMGDVEMYFERLRGLHKSVADTEKNLAAAYEMLSRKVTICMELPPVERYNKPEATPYHSKFSTSKEITPSELDDFDNLPDHAEAGPLEKKSGAISWNEI